jgi:membrane protein required for colicin V production
MNWLDIALVILLLIPAFIGLKAGIIKILLTVAGVIVGVVLAGRLSGPLGERLPFISDPGTAKVAAFAFILVAVLVLAAIAAFLIRKAVSAILLGWVDKLVGAVLGLLLGAIFWGAILTVWVKFLGPGDTIMGSVLAGFLLDGFPVVLGLLPAEFDSVRSFFN